MKNNMRIITVVMGEPDSNTRNAEIRELFDYAFAQYEIEVLLNEKQIIDNVRVEKGTEEKTNIIPSISVNILRKKIDPKKAYTYETKIDNIKAPIKQGDIIGEITILENDKKIKKVNLTVDKDIEKASIVKLYLRYLKEILIGNITFD